jgi:HSP20 family protein
MTDEMERMFDAVFPTFFNPIRRESWYPAVDVVESADAVDVTAELPGLADNDVELNVRENVLTISGEKRVETEKSDEKRNVFYAERSYGRFERSLTLPAYVDAETATATFKNGVLTVHLPKLEQHKSRTIKVSGE